MGPEMQLCISGPMKYYNGKKSSEQMTIILRFVSILPIPDEKESYVDIREHFLSFIDIIDTTGAGMTEKILETLDSHGI